jgi:hypothetical protein
VSRLELTKKKMMSSAAAIPPKPKISVPTNPAANAPLVVRAPPRKANHAMIEAKRAPKAKSKVGKATSLDNLWISCVQLVDISALPVDKAWKLNQTHELQ